MNDTEVAESEVQTVLERAKGKNSLFDVATMFDGMEDRDRWYLQDDMYRWYSDAIQRRDREPLPEDSFRSHFFEGRNYNRSVAFGSPKDGFLLGSDINDVFVPTHFAPATLRGGYRLIKDLVDADTPTALFITADLVDTVSKMDGWKVLPFKLKTKFRGEDVEKTIVINRWSALTKLAAHEIGQRAEKAIDNIKQKIDELGKKAQQLFSKDNHSNADDINEELVEAFGNN